MKLHSIVLAVRNAVGEVFVQYASPDAYVLIDEYAWRVESNVPVEIYEPGVDDKGEYVVLIGDGTEFLGELWRVSHREFYTELRKEVDIRRNGDKRQGLIGG